MATLTQVTTFKESVVSINGGGLFDSVTGTDPTFGTTNARTGGKYLIESPSADIRRAGRTLSAANVTVFSIYIRIPTSLPAASSKLFYIAGTDSVNAYFGYDQSLARFYIQYGSGTAQTLSSITPAANTWYRVDMRVTANANPHTCDCQVAVDGDTAYAFTQATSQSATASTCSGWRLGTDATSTYTCWYSDLAISATTGDYPIGTHDTATLTPNSDGTHNAGTNVIEDNAGTDIGTTTAYDKINSVSSGSPSATTYIRQAATGTGNYFEVNLSDLPAGATPLGAAGFFAYQSAGTAANQGAFGYYDGTFREVWGNPTTRADFSESSIFYKQASLSAVTMTKTSIDALKARGGYSNDVTPNPYWVDAWVAVAYTTSSGTTLFRRTLTDRSGSRS